MNWLNINLSTLRSPAYLGSTPVERATWLQLLAYCTDQENGGCIAGAASWKDRQWQQTCGVTAREVRAAARLVGIEGGDVRVAYYPLEKEAEVVTRRKAATEAANRRWHGKLHPGAKDDPASDRANDSGIGAGNDAGIAPAEEPVDAPFHAEADAPAHASRIAPVHAEENGKEVQGKGKYAAPALAGTRVPDAVASGDGHGCAPVCLSPQAVEHGATLEPPCPEQWCLKWWEDSERRGWLGPDGLRIEKWKPALSSYWRGVQIMEMRVAAQQGGGGNGPGNGNNGNGSQPERPLTAYAITTKLRGIEEELGRMRLLAKDGRSDDGLRTIKLYTPDQEARREQLLKAKEVLRRKLTEVG